MRPAANNLITSLEREYEEQRRWCLLAKCSQMKLFDRLVENEFLPPEIHEQRQLKNFQAILQYSRNHVPYYQANNSLRCQVAVLGDLAQLPILSKYEVIEHFEKLQYDHSSKARGPVIIFSSSGTTGRPVKVAHTNQSMEMFSIFWQRQARWFRQDPMALAARIRLPESLPPRKDGSLLTEGQTYTRKRWSHIGMYFQTGPEIGCTLGNSRDWQIRWLQKHQPKYLQSFPGFFEELALANECKKIADSIECLIGVASLLTDSMRNLIERVFEAPVNQNYGMNEVGIVAARCLSGRYHIHSEHCLVEIVDMEGLPVQPGDVGRIIVSTFNNLRMPLLRYDTGDMAVAAKGPCPCGRTLPSIGEIAGRYRRFAHLPEGTRPRYHAIFGAIEAMPDKLLKNLRQYQVHQYRDGRFELRIRTAGALPGEFQQTIVNAWLNTVDEHEKELLNIKEVDKIEGAPGGKILEFSSDFFPDEDSDIIHPDFEHS